MTLYEYLRDCKEDEVDITDQDYDVLIYFYYADEREEEALSEVIENNLDNGSFDDLFIHNDVDSIMDDIENILSGNVSEDLKIWKREKNIYLVI